MSLTVYVKKRLIDMLEEKRVIVWYDGENAFGNIAKGFAAPNTAVVISVASRLRARREADEALSRLNDLSQSVQVRSGNILVYCPWSRGLSVNERLQDPFESFALLGAAFGDKEVDTFQSLARQAMPERTVEINRLFVEGVPTLALIEGLGADVRYPLLQEALGTDSPIENTAQLLCRDEAAKKLAGVAGADAELLRSLQAGMGFVPPSRITALESVIEHLGRYILFSEFALSLPKVFPDQLSGVPRAAVEYRDAISTLCDRMRGSDDTRDGYIALAERVEKSLRLAEVVGPSPELGVRDTFPFQEKAQLKQLESLCRAGNLTEARTIVEQRRQSVWRHIPERALLWKVAERCVDFLTAAAVWNDQVLRTGNSVRELVQAYAAAEGFWQTDRQQRLVEQGSAECAEADEVSGLISICRQRYTEVVGTSHAIFLRSVEREGWPPEGIQRQTQTFGKYVSPALEERRKVAFFLVDAMRYEMGRDLGTTLEAFGSVTVAAAATVLPTSTPCGMAALMPGADGAFALVQDGADVSPSIGGRILRNSADRMRLLSELKGDLFRDFPLGELLSMPQKKLLGAVGNADLVVIRSQEIDSLGEGPSLYLARKLMSDIIGDVRTATDRLIGLGFETFVYAADHGHVLLPEVAPGSVAQKPPGEWKMVKRRALLGKSISKVSGVMLFRTAHLGITGPVEEFAVPAGLSAFEAGHGYFHEGLSLQECLIPVVVLQSRGRRPAGTNAEIVEIRYRADRFTSRIVGVRVWFNALFTDSLTVRVDAYDGSGAKAKLVGEAADCEARDPATRLVTLMKGNETQVPIRIDDKFDGASVEIRATDPATGTIFHRLKLKNSVME